MANKLKYKLANLKTLKELREGAHIYSAEYTLPVRLENDEVAIAQFDMIEEDYKVYLENKVYDLTLINNQVAAVETKVQNVDYLESSSLGILIKKHLDLFFNNLSVFKDLGITNVKRGILLHSLAGQGKTSSIAKLCREYSSEKNACVLVWGTDTIEPDSIKQFITKVADFSKVSKMVIVIEDLGGGNLDQGLHHNGVDSSLLNFLDGLSVTFPVPTFLLATTNQPDSHLPSLTSRPGRFDLVIKVNDLTNSEKLDFYKFFAKTDYQLTSEQEETLLSRSKKFAIAHIKETFIRAKLEHSIMKEKTLSEHILHAANEIKTWIEQQENGLLAQGGKGKRIAFGNDEDF